jgi:serine/threonine protein kinase
MAEVFKAKSYGVEGFEKIIAIKRILPTMGEDRDFIKMFIDEAKIAGQLAHANICQIFELGRIEGSHFIAMEYIWGKDLLQIQNRIRKLKSAIPVQLACFVISKVLEGLDYAHRKRDPLGRPLEIVHRDCSPQNVLVSYEGEVKVIDFGIAKATSRNSRTMAGVLKGKFGYMSPEQVRGLPLDRRSDIFALGTMLYECLTGERLFQGETDFSTLEKVRNVDVQPPRAVNPNIPEAVEKVILKALAKDVDDRYQWCSEMLADLQQYLMSQEVVFTAKSLSGWLKETFQQEIDRERQQLEQYKRVGRDGLIAGVPAAEAKLDVVEHLGEAGAPEGDATTLGGPNFDDIEPAVGAAPDPSKSPQEPRHSVKKAAKPGNLDVGWDDPTATADGQEEEGDDFSEEQPTEIFGEIAENPAAAAGGPPPSAAGRTPTSPPNKPPPRPGMGRPSGPQPVQQPMAAMQPGMPGPDPLGQTAPAPVYPQNMPYGVQQPYGTPPQPQMAQPGMMPAGTPGSMPVDQHMAGMAPPGSQPGRTVLGVQAPQGMPNYANYRPSQPMPGYPPPNASYPPYAMQQPGMQQYPGGPMMGQGLEPLAPVVEGKRSTLIRDIGIGVAIAALVLIGFLAVKMFVLDKGNDATGQQSPSSIATIKLAMTPGVTAELFVDDKKVASVSDGQSVPLTPGLRRVKLVGPNNARCEEPIKLEPGQTTTLECNLALGAGSATAGSAAPSGSAAPTATGSAAPPQVAAVGSAAGSAETPATDTKATDTKATDKTVKPTDTKTTHPATTTTKPDTSVKTTKPDTTTTHPATPPTPPDTKVTKPDTTTKPATPPNTPPPPAGGDDPTKGYVNLTSKPSAKIFIDGTDSGKSTPIKLPLAPGKHKISFVVGDDRYTYPVTVKAGETVAMQKDLQ